MASQLTPADQKAFDQDGYVIIRNLFSPAEIDLLYRLSTDKSEMDHAFDFQDQTGKNTKLTLWFTPGDDTFGLMSR